MPNRRPRILFVSSCWPLGKAFGGQMRALHTAQALENLGDVSILVASSEASNTLAAEATASRFHVQPPIIPGISSDIGLTSKFRRLLDTRYLNIHGVVAAPTESSRLESYFPEYDLVWVLNSRTANIVSIWRWPHAHLDIDDVPSTYFRTVSQSATRPLQRWKARVQQHLMKQRELKLRQRFETLSVCSESDRSYLGGHRNIHLIPNGFQRPASEPIPTPDPARPLIGFIGLYSYAPNVDGVRWFLNECWPAIRKAVPGIRLRLIGKDTDGPLKPTDPDVDALGWVADPAAEIATWSCMIVPIRFGGGTRIKIAEAFSRKVPAVSTSVGAFGYEVEHGKQLLLADRPEDFSAACIQLVKNPRLGEEVAERAWNDYLTKWTWDAIAPKVWAAAEDCLRRSGSRKP